MTRLDEQARLAVEGADVELAMTTFGPLPLYIDGDNSVKECAPVAGQPARRGDYISTYTGRFWPMDPRADEVRIEDIAHSLSMQCRYAGHGKRFYSVAEHSVHIARWCTKFGPHAALTGLLHDATEAYLVDVPRPVKAQLAGYKEAEARVWRVIAGRFDLDVELPSVVHQADSRIICDEMDQNMHETDPAYINPLGIQLQFWQPETAKLYFMDTFRKLMALRGENMRVAA